MDIKAKQLATLPKKSEATVKNVYDPTSNMLHIQSEPYLDTDGTVKVKRLCSVPVVVEKAYIVVEEVTRNPVTGKYEPTVLPDNELVTVRRLNPTNFEQDVVRAALRDVIINPGTYSLEDIGLALLNKERDKLGLPQYKLNPLTGTYDVILKGE